MVIIENGLYTISDQFFIDFPDPCLSGNKGQNRPHYYSFSDEKTGLLWVIPLTTSKNRLEDYKKRVKYGKPNDIYHKMEVDGKTGLLVIANLFPTSEEYIEKAYEVKGIPFVVKSQSEIRMIKEKTAKVLTLLRHNIKLMKFQADIFEIERKLIGMRTTEEENTKGRI